MGQACAEIHRVASRRELAFTRERSRGAESFFIGLGQALVDLRELVLREGVPSVLARSIRVYTCGCQQFSGGWSPQSMCTASELLGLCA